MGRSWGAAGLEVRVNTVRHIATDVSSQHLTFNHRIRSATILLGRAFDTVAELHKLRIICAYFCDLHTKAPARRPRGHFVIDRVGIRYILLINAVVRVHIIVAAIEET